MTRFFFSFALSLIATSTVTGAAVVWQEAEALARPAAGRTIRNMWTLWGRLICWRPAAASPSQMLSVRWRFRRPAAIDSGCAAGIGTRLILPASSRFRSAARPRPWSLASRRTTLAVGGWRRIRLAGG